MSSPEVATIVNDFKQAQTTHDFSHVVFEVGQLQRQDGMGWQKDAADINRGIAHLGFHDFQIVGTDDKGRLLTTSTDGKQFQARDPIHLDVQDHSANQAKTEQWGKRQFSVNADGSSHYQVQKGDTYWSVVKDALQARDPSHPPANTEIADTLRQLAQQQGRPLSQLNKLHPGDSIDIPMPKPAGDGTYKVQAPGTVSDADRSNPLNPPGTDGRFNKDATTTTSTMDHETRMTTTTSKGELDDSVVNGLTFGLAGHGTQFENTDVKDGNGYLINRDTKYGQPTDLLFTDENGATRQFNGVGEVSTRFNNYSGQYETTITGAGGKTYRVTSDKSGKTIGMTPKPDEYAPPAPAYPS
ncbi:MAG TPA: hypothetical protein V6C69_05285 [Trichormus sp.]|jgi:hypothetical protein